jgi:glycosyltransferase involved in cell wall biosynthesis
MTPVRLGFGLEQLLAPVPGGTGRYSRELAAALATSAPDGCGVQGWTAWHRSTASAEVAGVAGPRRLPLGERALAEAWRRGVGPVPRGDMLHAPTLLVPPVSGVGRRWRAPLVVTIHDAVPWTHPETLTARGARWHRDMAQRVARDADAVVVPTHAVAAELARHLPLRRVEVIGEGVSAAVARVPEDADERAERLRLPPEGYALVVGTLEPRKGLDVALAATRLPAWPGLPLLVVGPSGWGEVVLRGAGDAVRLLGRLTDPDLAVAYARSSVVLVPSRAEGFGLPALEAMAHSVPVVTSDIPALVEVVGGAGIAVPVGDAVALAEGAGAALSRHADLRAAARGRAAAFTWDVAARACWELYRGLEMHSA